MKALVELLDNLPLTLRVLYLYNNRFGDGLVELVQHVHHLHRLWWLDISNNDVSEGVKKEIREGLKQTLPGLEDLEI